MSELAALDPSVTMRWQSPLSRARQDIDVLTAKGARQERYADYAEVQRAGLVDKANEVIALEVGAENYTRSQQVTKARLDKTAMLMEQMREGITQFQQSVISYRGGAGQANHIDLKDLATKALQILQNQMNEVGIDGNFLFGSLDTSTAPVGDIVTVTCLDANNNPTTSYTTDREHSTPVQLSYSVTVRVDTFVGLDAFRNLIGGLQVFAFSALPLNNATLDNGTQLLNASATQVTGLITATKTNLTKLEQAEKDVAALKLQAAEIHDALFEYKIVDSTQAIADAREVYEYMLFIQGMLLKLPRLSDILG